MNRHIVLVGLPGSGKSTVGALLASRLGMRFVDTDGVISHNVGKSVADIFREDGEPAFRAYESAAVRRALEDKEPAVISPGGGWAAQPGNLEDAAELAMLVYLETSPAVAAARVERSGGRPVLEEPSEAGMAGLLAVRESSYRRAALIMNTDSGTPLELAERIAVLAQTSEG